MKDRPMGAMPTLTELQYKTHRGTQFTGKMFMASHKCMPTMAIGKVMHTQIKVQPTISSLKLINIHQRVEAMRHAVIIFHLQVPLVEMDIDNTVLL